MGYVTLSLSRVQRRAELTLLIGYRTVRTPACEPDASSAAHLSRMRALRYNILERPQLDRSKEKANLEGSLRRQFKISLRDAVQCISFRSCEIWKFIFTYIWEKKV